MLGIATSRASRASNPPSSKACRARPIAPDLVPPIPLLPYAGWDSDTAGRGRQGYALDRCVRCPAPLPARGATGILAIMRPLLALLLLTSCGTPAPGDGRWSGDMTPMPEVPGCPAGRATLVGNGGAVLFTPNEGTLSLDGSLAPGGTITAASTRIGADKKEYATRFAARLDGDRIAGTYTTPRCKYAVVLQRR